MPNQNKGHLGKQPKPYPPELVSKFLDVQQQEMQVRAQELTIRTKQEETNKTLAEASIFAQLQDRENGRKHFEKRLKIIFTGISIVIVIIAIFSADAIFSGNGDIVKKLLEIISYITAGFIGGYGFKASRQ